MVSMGWKGLSAHCKVTDSQGCQHKFSQNNGDVLCVLLFINPLVNACSQLPTLVLIAPTIGPGSDVITANWHKEALAWGKAVFLHE